MDCTPGPTTKTERYRINSADSKKKFLHNDFIPGDNDVIVGRGKKCYGHSGNKILRQLVKAKLKEYSASTCKYDKSNILSAIADQVRITGGNFVKEDLQTGKWYDVGNSLARDKISQTFRDALHDKYKSSTLFKTNKRREDKIKASSSQFKPYCYQRIENLDTLSHQRRFHQRPALDWGQNSPHYYNTPILDLDPPSTPSFNSSSFNSEEEKLPSSSLNALLVNSDISRRMEGTIGAPKVEQSDPFQPIPMSKALNVEDDVSVSSSNAGVNENSYDPFEPIELSNGNTSLLQLTEGVYTQADNDCLEPIQLETLEPIQLPHCNEDGKDCFAPIMHSHEDKSYIAVSHVFDAGCYQKRYLERPPVNRLISSSNSNIVRRA